MLLRRPSVFLALSTSLLIAIVWAVAQYAARLPSLGVTLTPVGDELIVERLSGPDQTRQHGLVLPARLTFVSGTSEGSARIKISHKATLMGRPEVDIRQDDLETQDDLLALARSGSVRLWLQDKNGGVTTIDRQVGDTRLPLAFWLIVLTGLFGAVIGLWLVVMRSGELAARAAALAGLALLATALPVAVAYSAEFIMGGRLYAVLLNLNSIGGQVFGAAFLCLFATYPGRLFPQRITLIACFALGSLVLPIVLFVPSLAARSQWVSALIGLDLILIIVALTIQWRRTAYQPLGRAYLRLVGSVTGLSLGAWVAFYQLPVAAGWAPLMDFSYGFLLTLAPFAAIALGISRGHLFDLDRWAWRLLTSAAVLLALIVADLLLVLGVGLAPGPAASGSLLLVGGLWLVARNRALDAFLGSRRISPLRLSSDAVHAALAPTASQRFERWTLALGKIFEPLELVAAPPDSAGATLRDQGHSLFVPAPAFGHALLLRGARQGRSLFRQEDCETVSSLLLICRQIDAGREAYDRGMREERERIARDLHDDVSARLLTSLHREDPDQVRTDVRAAIADIRTIVAGLEGQECALDELLGSLRQDVCERLEAAGIACAWAVDEAVGQLVLPVSYPVYKALTSALREAISNVIRHARASRVEVLIGLEQRDDTAWLSVTIADDGIGIASDAPRGHGSRNIKDRLHALGGRVEHRPGPGAALAMSMPLGPSPPGPGYGGRSWPG